MLCYINFNYSVIILINTRLHSHLILRFCLDFGNKNTEILYQLWGKRLTTCIIHNFKFTGHNYRLSALQIKSWYSISGVFLTVLQQGGGNNQFEKRFRQKLEKCFINIKILPRLAELSVAMTLCQKSTKLYLIFYILSS